MDFRHSGIKFMLHLNKGEDQQAEENDSWRRSNSCFPSLWKTQVQKQRGRKTVLEKTEAQNLLVGRRPRVEIDWPNITMSLDNLQVTLRAQADWRCKHRSGQQFWFRGIISWKVIGAYLMDFLCAQVFSPLCSVSRLKWFFVEGLAGAGGIGWYTTLEMYCAWGRGFWELSRTQAEFMHS